MINIITQTRILIQYHSHKCKRIIIMISDRVSKRLKEIDMSPSELARKSGIPVATTYRIINGEIKSPRAENLPALAKALRVSIDWLVTGKELQQAVANTVVKSVNNQVIQIPQFDITASMGGGNFPPDYQQPVVTITVDKDFFTRQGINVTSGSKLSIITGMGDSMEGTFNSGDPVVVNHEVQSLVEDGVYVFTLGDRLYLKRLQILPSCVRMISDNVKYPPYDIKGEELQGLIIHGQVLFAWNGRRV